jgi:serine/threonine protein kinase
MSAQTAPPRSSAEAAEAMPNPAYEATPRLSDAASPALPMLHAGRYRLEQRLGEGGLGTVWEACDTTLQRRIAVKTLSVSLPPGERDAAIRQVIDEARTAARLSHPHIVTVHDAGMAEEGPYIAMELLRGKDLGQLLRSGWRPDPEQAVMIVRRVADALGYAHSKGVIHRDIKPANIFMVGRTRPIVLDFGIARLLHRSDAGPVRGSPYYAAPEQLQGLPCDHRSDVYSLGVVLYELLTGQRPYQGRDLADIQAAVLAGRPTPPRQLQPLLPEALEYITLQAMALDPAQRQRSAGALARELRLWLSSTQAADAGPAALEEGLSLPAAEPVSVGAQAPASPTVPRQRRLWRGLIFAGFALSLLMVLLIARGWLGSV